jgi:heptosyltransferase-3
MAGILREESLLYTNNFKNGHLSMRYGDYPEFDNVKKILVIKLRHLGDVLLTGPVFTNLKIEFPGAQVDAYIYDEAAPILEGHPSIDRLLVYSRQWKQFGFFGRLGKEWALLRKIRKEGYDLVINLTEGDRGAVAAILSGAEIRVGFAPKGRWLRNSLTHVVKSCSSLRHTVERNLDALRRIGIFPSWEERELFFHVPAAAKESILEKLGEAPFVLIHPTSRWKFKCWPVKKMRELIERLQKSGKRVILSCGPDRIEREMVEEISRGLNVLNVGGEISLKELGALIEASELLICVDSVPFHMANALKKSVVALFGPTSEVTWGPWRNPKAQIVAQKLSCRPCYQDGCGGSKVSDCLENLSVDFVFKACLSKMEVFAKIGASRMSVR